MKPAHEKYIPFVPLKMTRRAWPDRELKAPPVWCSVDLRDGNQALIDPMNVREKLELFHTLVDIGVKEIEVGFPSASETEYEFIRTLIEGVIRVGIFLLYIWLISRMEDIRRVFMYHGAEHKTINCLEHGDDLTPENIRRYSRFHKRCGTSFLLIVMIVSIIVFLFIRVDEPALKFVLRVLLVPVIAGISYEFIRLAGRSNSRIMDILSRPGMSLQFFTTREPDDAMLEVAIASVEGVFDWREYVKAVRNGELED